MRYLCVAVFVWLAAAATGLWVVWAYDNAPGTAATAPSQWPATSALSRATTGPTLVLIAHPHCSCTRASLGELAEVLARARVRPKTYILFLKPDGFGDGWEQTDLWRTAAALPGVTLVGDDAGTHARHFGAVTSGQTLLYDAQGTLRFSGGVTGARAHAGDNAGRQSLVALLNRGEADRNTSNVFGCPLFADGR